MSRHFFNISVNWWNTQAVGDHKPTYGHSKRNIFYLLNLRHNVSQIGKKRNVYLA